MERRAPLRSKTPLKRGKPPARKKPLPRMSSKKAAAGPQQKRYADTGPDRVTRALVKKRDAGRCAVCGVPVRGRRPSVHHRRNRGSGGSKDPAINRLSNLLLVCGSGVSFCHGELTQNRDRSRALAAGWVVSLNGSLSPAEVPVVHAVHGLVFLMDDGGVEPVPAAGEEQ